MKSLWTLIEKHKDLKEPYYIMEILQPDAILPNAIKMKHIARKTRPKPEWGIALYKVDNSIDECFYEWGLPHKSEALIMIQNPAGWESKSMQDIIAFARGTLV